jgi:hypothetical protein
LRFCALVLAMRSSPASDAEIAQRLAQITRTDGGTQVKDRKPVPSTH